LPSSVLVSFRSEFLLRDSFLELVVFSMPRDKSTRDANRNRT
jgi:hypothetical protein